MQLEGVLGGHPRGAVCLRALDHLGEQPLALLERAAEALLFGAGPALDRGPLADEVGIGVTHHVPHALAYAHEEGLVDAEDVRLLNRAAHDPAQHVAAVLVRGHDAVGEQVRGAATVVGDHAEGASGREVLAVPFARELLAQLDERLEEVGLVDRRDALHDARHPLEAHARVDVLGGQFRQRAVRLELVLHEDEVPELEEALGVVARAIGVRSELRPAVEVELRAGAARSGGAGLPEVVVYAEPDDALLGHPDGPPVADGLLSGPRPSFSSPPNTVIQMSSKSRPKPCSFEVESSSANATACSLK